MAVKKKAVKKTVAKSKRGIKKQHPKKRAAINSIGRPTKYLPEYCEQVRKLCLLGATDKEIAGFFNTCEATINNWKIKYPDFLESIMGGKIGADALVAEKLFTRAVGFTRKVVKTATFEGMITDEKEVDDHVIPDVNAARYWLNNRRQDRWRNAPEEDGSNDDDLTEALKSLAAALPN